MDVQVFRKPAFAVIGIEGRGPASTGPQWVGPLWGQAFQRIGKIQHLITGDAWGLMSDVDEYLARWKENGRYLAGWQLKLEVDPVKGWTIWQIPASTFAVIPCTLKTYQEALHYGNEVFLKTGVYEQAGAIHEYYPPEFSNPETDMIALYFMVKEVR